MFRWRVLATVLQLLIRQRYSMKHAVWTSLVGGSKASSRTSCQYVYSTAILLAKSFILLHVQIANTYDEMSQQSDTSFKCQTTPSSLELLTVTPPLQHISLCGSLLTRSKQLCLTIVGCNNTAKHHSPTRLHKRRTKLPLGEITIWSL